MPQFDRRNFLAAGGSMLAATALTSSGTGTASAAAASSHGLRKAVKYTMVGGKGTVEEKFRLLKKLGFEGVDINRPLPHDEVRKAQDATGLIVHGTVGYDHWRKPLSAADPEVRKQGLESFIRYMKDAKAYGGTSALLVPAVVSKDVSYGDAYKRSQAEIRKALRVAEEIEIQILIENVWNNFLLSPVELARYIDEFDSPMIGSYFDIGNVVRFGWPEHWIAALGSRIRKLDIKEYSTELQHSKGPRAGFGVKLGEGSVDWPVVMKSLAAIGFKGWATAEVRGGDEARLKEISERMDACFGDR